MHINATVIYFLLGKYFQYFNIFLTFKKYFNIFLTLKNTLIFFTTLKNT